MAFSIISIATFQSLNATSSCKGYSVENAVAAVAVAVDAKGGKEEEGDDLKCKTYIGFIFKAALIESNCLPLTVIPALLHALQAVRKRESIMEVTRGAEMLRPSK